MSRKAFTLVEVLAVVAIIALLVGILMPAVTRARQLAAKVVCSSNLRQVGLAVQIYRDQNDDDYPLARYMPSPFITVFPDDPTLPQALKADLGGETDVWICPGDKEYVYSICQEDSQTSYAYNAVLAGVTYDESGFFLRGIEAADTPVLRDCDGHTFILDPPHQPITVPFFHLQRNILFADGHVDSYSTQED